MFANPLSILQALRISGNVGHIGPFVRHLSRIVYRPVTFPFLRAVLAMCVTGPVFLLCGSFVGDYSPAAASGMMQSLFLGASLQF
jgi:hypothetical protein